MKNKNPKRPLHAELALTSYIAFTMDENLCAAVTETFVQLHEEGIIYRANRLVNWCTKLNTALSNLEVVNKELPGRTLLEVPGYDKKVEFGVIVHFKYPIEGSDETVEVATTRIETMLGDTGIAVNPKDPRYTHLVGKTAIHPFVEGRKLPIIADEYVDMEFGTGAVKLTPAHDPNDFTLGQQHGLEFINILTDDGFMNENAGPYKGQKRFDVRYTIQEDLKKKGLYVDKKDNAMKVPLCDKSKDIIEPLMKPQWWVRTKDLAGPALEAVRSGEIKIRPETAERSYYRWLEDINDWCISRQLWWGHRCPVYFAKVEGETGDVSDDKRWFSGRTREEAEEKARKALPGKTFTLEQDEDVLDSECPKQHDHNLRMSLTPCSLVLVGSLAIQHAWLAQADSRSREAVPYVGPGNRLGYSVLLDRQNDHARSEDDWQGPLHRGLLPQPCP